MSWRPHKTSRYKSIQQLLKPWQYGYSRINTQMQRAIHITSLCLGAVSVIAAIICILSLITYVGYNITTPEARSIMVILHAAQAVFAVHIAYQLIFYFKVTVHDNRIVKWIVDICIVTSVLAWLIPNVDISYLPWLKTFLLSKKFLFVVLGAYSIVELSYALSYIPGRRTNPSLLMALSFLVFIVIGSFMLRLPKCTYHGISYFDSLFLASSAVSITGLSPVDISSTFTPFGLIVLSVLIQLGSLGIITFTSFFALFYTGSTSIYNQLLLRDVVYSKSMNSLVPTLLYILGFTIAIECTGALIVFMTLPPDIGLGLEDKIAFSAFHAMSSFCNAGFSSIRGGMSNPVFMHSNQAIYIVTSVLIFAGGVGFPILVNLRSIASQYIKRIFNRLSHRRSKNVIIHIFDLNTKIVLYTTLSILLIGTASFLALEYDNTLRGMSLYDKVVQSVFNSLIPRSAGFSSVNPGSMLDVTLLLIMVQMIIGGSSQSMAGGIKVNTVGAVLLNLKSVVLGHKGTSAFKRTINVASVRRANAVVIIAAISLLAYLITVMLLEPRLPSKSIIFEVISALFTVGSSLGITSELSNTSKVVLSTAMFLGRVGILSLVAGITISKHDASEYYPTDNVIIN